MWDIFKVATTAFIMGVFVSTLALNNIEEYEILKRTVVIKKEVLIKNNLATYNKDTGEFILMIGE